MNKQRQPNRKSASRLAAPVLPSEALPCAFGPVKRFVVSVIIRPARSLDLSPLQPLYPGWILPPKRASLPNARLILQRPRAWARYPEASAKFNSQ